MLYQIQTNFHKNVDEGHRVYYTVLERKISNIFPKKLFVVCCGRRKAGTYYLALYATFSSNIDLGYDRRLLSFTPLAGKVSSSAQTHIETIELVLGEFYKSLDIVVTIVLDNFAIIQDIS